MVKVSFSALYDLRKRSTTYDYFTWQAHVQAMGANEIVFQADEIISTKYGLKEARKRFDNFILPGPALSELKCRLGTDGRDIGSSMLQELVRLPYPFRRMKSLLPARSERYTVTLRQTFRKPERNSDEFIWREFARRIGAYVIEDHSVEPISLYDRMALYAGAKMNFGIPNGPMGLLYLTEYPFMIFSEPEITSKGFAGHGIKVGDQLPTALRGQTLVWERPTVKIMMREFEKIQC
jgi:hypothetical protein